MIHWVTAHDHVGSHTHSSRKRGIIPLYFDSSDASRSRAGGVPWHQHENKITSRVFSWHNRSREESEDHNDIGLRQQHMLNDGEYRAPHRPRKSELEVYENGILVDSKSTSTTNDLVVNPEDNTHRPDINASAEEIRSTENLRPLPLVCRRTGMSPGI